MSKYWWFSARRRGSRSVRLLLEPLETREQPAAVTVNVGQMVRPVNNHVLGVNLVWWDSNLNTAQTQQMSQAAGLTMFRLPGGSSTDDFHFNAPPTYNGEGTVPSMAGFIASVGGSGLVTLDYGSGSPQEAAAELAYLNAPLNSTAAIGPGEEWSDTASTWMIVDWKMAGSWAGLRAAKPLTQDDGLNFLRLNRAAPFGFHYFEVGNEVYGSWETDHHGQGGDPGKLHDPATYAAFAQQFAALAASIDSTIAIGVDSGGVNDYTNWLGNVLQQGSARGFIPNFVSDHSYMQGPGSESDANLLLNTVSNPGSALAWAVRASGYRALLQQKLGASAGGVELLATEFNSVYSNPGKQTTSLVNGLFVADSLGSLLQTEYNGADIWDLRNSWVTTNNNASSLYGWRLGGDYGLLGGSGTAPSTGTYVPYPTYFAEQLVSHIVHPGDIVVQASSNDPNLSVYAVHQATGHLDLLVINKNATTDLAGQFQISGFQPNAQAQVWQYGKTQDTAQSQTSDGHSALANFSTTLVVNGSSFSYTFPSYSMTVLDLATTPSSVAATAGTPQSTTVNTVFATVLQATVLDQNGNPVLGVPVTFAAPAAGASGTFSNAGTSITSTSDSSGHVAEVFTANATTGRYTVTASVAGISTPAAFSLTNTGPVVSSLTSTPTGFVANFSVPIDPTKINLYDITLTGTVTNPNFAIPGSVVLSNNNQILTFVATNLELPDDTYTLDLTSSGNPHPPHGAAPGFQSLSAVPLDGAGNAGAADYGTSFTTTYNSSGLTLSVPGFARGPGQPVNLDLVNFHNAASTAGIPIQLSGAGTATTVSVPLSYNANLLTITNVTNATSPAGGTFSVATSGAGASATATFTFTANGSVTASSTPVTLGQLTASVPSGAAYKTKWLLHVGTATVHNGASPVTAVGQDGVQVVDFLGNASGQGNYSPLDASLMANYANTGALFPNFPLADPSLIAGIDGAIDPNSISQVLQFNLNKSVPGIPGYTGAPANNPSGPDPVLAVGSGQWAVGSGQTTVPVNIDDPHPAGSSGLMFATLALTYDPKVLSVSPRDIHLGTVPKAGTGWILAVAVDPGSGQIGITLYSLTPINSASAGSLVTIDFHVQAGSSFGASAIELVRAVDVGGQEIQTALADTQGFLTLHLAPTNALPTGRNGPAVAVATHTAAAAAQETPVETATDVPSAFTPEANDALQSAEAGNRAAALALLPAVFLIGPNGETNLALEGGAALAAGAVPLSTLAITAAPRLLEAAPADQVRPRLTPGERRGRDALFGDAPDLGLDLLADQPLNVFARQGRTPQHEGCEGTRPESREAAEADYAALDHCFTHGGADVE